MKEVVYNGSILDSRDQSVRCAYGDKKCTIDCPHFEYVPASPLKDDNFSIERYGKMALEAKIIITCSGSPVTLKVKEI